VIKLKLLDSMVDQIVLMFDRHGDNNHSLCTADEATRCTAHTSHSCNLHLRFQANDCVASYIANWHCTGIATIVSVVHY
jgi:hypothetical protein